MPAKSYQLETEANGALNLACQRAQPFAAAARAAGTRRVYSGALKRWQAWCAEMHATALPAAPEAVAAYLAELARGGKAVSTITGALAAIKHAHASAGLALDPHSPAIAAVMAGIARCASRPLRRAAALDLETFRTLIARIDGTDVRALRDRALLLIGFFGALRRSELVSLDIGGRSRIDITAAGLILHLTDTKGQAATETLAIPRRQDALCAAAALERYLAATQLRRGPLFRAVNKAGRLGARRLDATSVRHILIARVGAPTFSPHSLRAGFITAAAQAGAPEHLIQRVSRHKSVNVLRGYIRAGEPFATSAAHYL
ncbi:tyrosine-type recombinase/integrase [Hyphomicrobium sp.]|uniref:tyrosine-type recombinase/integrase n=2 Tax=Hyphomicrobium sp. TaxID=82 RepID=UPI0025C0EB9C|nr:tyrosine-type recombinase/integrase [Hyphomicrobium sp.]